MKTMFRMTMMVGIDRPPFRNRVGNDLSPTFPATASRTSEECKRNVRER